MTNENNNDSYVTNIELLLHIMTSISASEARIRELEMEEQTEEVKKRLKGLFSTVETLKTAAVGIVAKLRKHKENVRNLL
jgi:uncharacterized membrane protein